MSIPAKGKLIIVPTFLNEELPLESQARELIEQSLPTGPLIVVEEIKVARRRWINSGLPREWVEKMVLLNEHSQDDQSLLLELKQGRTLFLMSDCGLPSFFDPGQRLIADCHKQQIQVSATPFANSFSLALALSGFDLSRFIFCGHPPKSPSDFWKKLAKESAVQCFHDAPYRLNQTLQSLAHVLDPNRELFVALDLGLPTERLTRCLTSEVGGRSWPKKAEFVVVVGAQKN